MTVKPENVPATVRELWAKLGTSENGRREFSALFGKIAPYSGSIGAVVRELSPDGAVVQLEEHAAVASHVGAIHALALANLAEMTGALAVSFQMPPDARIILRRLSIDYHLKARGRITASASCPPITTSTRADVPVEVTLRNDAGGVVATSTITLLVGAQRDRSDPT
jgi:acyl-coenzyme A thioesterase PaaI-like protein